MEYKMKLFNLLAVAAVVTMSGCSTLLTDETQLINVTSTKKDLQLEIDGKTMVAAGIIEIKKENKNKTLKVLSPGCEQTIALNKGVEPTFFVNILSGGMFGSTTDYSTEKMWRYQSTIDVICPE
jgi:uncharacterized protein YceK